MVTNFGRLLKEAFFTQKDLYIQIPHKEKLGKFQQNYPKSNFGQKVGKFCVQFVLYDDNSISIFF